MSDDITDDDSFELKVFGSDDPHLKKISELMANKTSKKIIVKLSQKPMYKNELVKELDLSMSLVDHHVKGLVESGVLKVTRKKLIRKGKEHNFFKMINGILILPNITTQEISDKKILQKIFKEGIKIMSLFLIGLILNFKYFRNEITLEYASSGKPVDITIFDSFVSLVMGHMSFFIIILLGLLVVLTYKKKLG